MEGRRPAGTQFLTPTPTIAIVNGILISYLREPAVFLHRLFVQSEGQSLAWETPGGLIDFHVDELWQRTHSKSFAAE
jgi:hypothetical protein